ncbi:putative ribonuclease H protein [Spatholobus suberectus]|nr:putative ribonuclease H protein [Spatholobus suberectus]
MPKQIAIIGGKLKSTHELQSIVVQSKSAEIHDIHRYQCHIAWNHVMCEANQVADLLPKFGLELHSCMHVFDVPPSFVANALRADSACICFPRGF